MKFKPTPLKDAYLIEMNPKSDSRGFFERVWCQNEFKKKGLCSHFVQTNCSYNSETGTLRGLHYQKAPHQEIKLVTCFSGSIYDVVVDVRSESETFGQWMGYELSLKNHRALYVPEGFAHGYLTLTPNTVVYYQVSEFYQPESERGIIWNDRILNIKWPGPVNLVSDKDSQLPGFNKNEK